MTEGPYYLPGDKVRRDMREGKPGVLLTVRTTVLDVSTCKPIKGAAVDLWHCDAAGTYSGFAQEGTDGETFLRGIQRTDAKGVAVLKTIYPGWYPGRTVHIHAQVHAGGSVVHTGQLFFPDRLTDTVYKRAPYKNRPNRSTRNANDSIFVNGGSRSILKLTKSGSGYVGRLTEPLQRCGLAQSLNELGRLSREKEIGARRAWRDDVGGDVAPAQFVREHMGHRLDAGLGGGIDAIRRLIQPDDAR